MNSASYHKVQTVAQNLLISHEPLLCDSFTQWRSDFQEMKRSITDVHDRGILGLQKYRALMSLTCERVLKVLNGHPFWRECVKLACKSKNFAGLKLPGKTSGCVGVCMFRLQMCSGAWFPYICIVCVYAQVQTIFENYELCVCVARYQRQVGSSRSSPQENLPLCKHDGLLLTCNHSTIINY